MIKLTEARLDQLESLLPRQRGNVGVANRVLLAAIAHVHFRGCAWRQLPQRFGNWHTIYTRVRRWKDSGVLMPVLQTLEAMADEDARQGETPAAQSVRERLAKESVPIERRLAAAEELRPLIFALYTHLKQERRQFRVSQLEVATMMSVEMAPGIGSSALALRLEVHAATMSVALRRLVQQGLLLSGVSRQADRRRVGLSVTAKGTALLNSIRAGRSDQLIRQFGLLDAELFTRLEVALPALKQLSSGLSKALPAA
jgi:DNA-binding MarR family transcriptional regulator